MSGRLQGRRAIVTGAGSGIGAAVADRLRRDGARVFTADIKGDVDFTADLTGPDANAGLVKAAVEAMGGLDTVGPARGSVRSIPSKATMTPISCACWR